MIACLQNLTDNRAVTEAADEAATLRQLLSAQKARAFAFFDTLADEARKPHYDDRSKGYTANLLIRAEECGLYLPPERR